MRGPVLQPPVYLSGAAIPPVPPAVREVCRKSAPFAGLLGAAALAATAGYFVPKLFDSALSAWRARDMEDGGGDGDEIELEIE